MTRTQQLINDVWKEVDVLEEGGRAKHGKIVLRLADSLRYSTRGLESFAFKSWEPVISDAIVVAAAIEYCDRTLLRPRYRWGRNIALKIPVEDPNHWNSAEVLAALKEAVVFLTGDKWEFSFVKRRTKASAPNSQDFLNFQAGTEAVIAFSDGLDSRAVAGIFGQALGDRLVRVRVGSKRHDSPAKKDPFTSVPYHVKIDARHKEPSVRSRGFKFALISGIAAYLTGAGRVIVPESGQGAIGPALATTGYVHADFRNHPAFTVRMTRFLKALLGRSITYEFPRIWSTKGETLKEFLPLDIAETWKTTKSCWRDNRWSSVNGKLRQCGICAACMLRRVSVFSAGVEEDPGTYVCVGLNAGSLEQAIASDFARFGEAFKTYAIAGVLHMDHMAEMAQAHSKASIKRHAYSLAAALNMSVPETEARLSSLFERHASEWNDFLNQIESTSFLKQWARWGQ
jgi:7-cyano-7-deazaguanine synthase in queuosine biosynthesis